MYLVQFDLICSRLTAILYLYPNLYLLWILSSFAKFVQQVLKLFDQLFNDSFLFFHFLLHLVVVIKFESI